MSEEPIVGPAVGSVVSFSRPGASAPETATVASRSGNDGTASVVLNFADGSTMMVAISDIQG